MAGRTTITGTSAAIAVTLLVTACGETSSDSVEARSVAVPATQSIASGAQPSTDPTDAAHAADAVSIDDLDSVGLDDGVDGVLEVYCLLDANGETHAIDAQLALPGFDPDDLRSMQWVHDVIQGSDGSARYISDALSTPEVASDLDGNSQIVLTDNTKTFLFLNKVPLIDVETIYAFRTGPQTASVLTTYVLDGDPQLLTQRWLLSDGTWERVAPS